MIITGTDREPTVYVTEFSYEKSIVLQDVRKTNRLGPTIRILGMIDRLEPTVKTFCQIWFNGTQAPVISKVLEYKYIWYKKWGNYKPGIFQPYLMACQLPKTHWKSTPISVSIVETICETATNNLRVIYNKLEPGVKTKTPFAVCVKGLDFPDEDISVRIVEWLEVLSSLGADKVFLYELEVHPNVTKVLHYYEKRGLVIFGINIFNGNIIKYLPYQTIMSKSFTIPDKTKRFK